MNYKIVIIGILLAGFGIIGASVYIGYSLRDVEVVENAYESGLKFDETLKNEARLGWHVEVPHELKVGTASDMVVTVKDKDGRPVTDAVVAVDFSRLGSRQNAAVLCSGGAEGRYAARQSLQTGYWDALVRVSRNNESITFNEIISVVR